ncbi:MAG TPA: hydrophobic protein [Actinocrinis sp.]|nr:hydrophobic protein [Actinocrinis sp.]
MTTPAELDRSRIYKGVPIMGVILLVLLVALLLGGLGFAAHVLWFVAVVVFIAWLVGFAVGGGANAGSRRGWYRRW